MKKRVPKFKNEDEEREFWATRDSTDYVDWKKAKRVVLPPGWICRPALPR